MSDVPSVSTFSRTFKEFAEAKLPSRVHEAVIKDGYADQLVGHLSRDSTAITGYEKPVRGKKAESEEGLKHKQGLPVKGEERPKEQTRLERQRTMQREEMLAELPKECTVGVKRNARGYRQKWLGSKLHLDAADGGIPISGVVTSASLHDSQVAIPLATMSQERVSSLYDLMDSAYDAKQIREHSAAMGHAPVIDVNPRRKGAEQRREDKAQREANFVPPERVRYRERSNVERVFGRLKDEFGGRHVRVRGHQKVTCHLMFGVLALTLEQLLRLVQ